MHITEVHNIIRVCHFELNESSKVKSLWSIIWDLEIDDNILKQHNGRCYFIVVDNEIFKIGYSDSIGGIKSTITSYCGSGNSGRPSDRTHGIHLLIAEQLMLGKNVEVYFHYNDEIEVTITLMDGTTKKINYSVSGKELERENKTIYKNKMGVYPRWNFQESGMSWPKYIQDSRNRLLSGQPATLLEIKDRVNNELTFNN